MLDKLRQTFGTYLCTVEGMLDESKVSPSNRLPDDGRPPPITWRVFRENLDNCGPADTTSEAPVKQTKRKNRAKSDEDPNENASPHDSTSSVSYRLYSFPFIDAIADAEETHLRSLGMGYRAKFLIGTARRVRELGGKRWLDSLAHLGLLDLHHSLGRDPSLVKSDLSEVPPLLDACGYPGTPGDGGSRLFVQQQLVQLPGVGPKVSGVLSD
jgi:hypothetical protein